MDELEQDAELRNGVNLYRNGDINQSDFETDDENNGEIDGVLTIIDL